MKKIFVIIGITALFAACGQKKQVETTASWIGSYNGILPCADCEGISTWLLLAADSTYSLQEVYLGKSDTVYQTDGEFTLNEKLVVLDNAAYNGFNTQYLIGDSTLTQLDADGNVIAGEWAEKYKLIKN